MFEKLISIEMMINYFKKYEILNKLYQTAN